MSDPIAEALARAAAAAAANPIQSTGTAVVAAQQGAVAPVGPAAVPQKLSMESMSQGGMSVDKWFKVTEDGIKIGDSKLITKPILARITMTEGSGFILKMGIKGGNPAQYVYTTDMVNAVGGGTWEGGQARIRALDPSARPYRAVDLPFTLAEDTQDATNAVVGKEGDVIGYTTPTTNWANWVQFHKEVGDAGLMGTEVTVKLTSQPRSNKNNNKWGVMAFELVNNE
jgi:hypothetical protein